MVFQSVDHLKTVELESISLIDVYNPVTGEKIGFVDNMSATEVAEVVAKARAAQPAWQSLGPKARAKIIERFGDLLVERQDELIEVIRAENGKSRGGAYGEVMVVASFADFYAARAVKWLKPERRVPFVRGLYSSTVHYKPLGVVGNISPWNYPLVLSFMDMIPALVAGNSVVLKPSEITPYSAIKGVEIAHEAGIPHDVLQVVTGYGVPTGRALIDNVDFVMFTGSTETGRKVAVQAAERLIPYSLELGGNDPMIVLRDADLEKAAANAVSAGFENTGQLCMSVERIIVEAPVYDAFIGHVKNWTERIVSGGENSLDVHMGSMTNENEMSRTGEHIQDALDKGARLITGGQQLEHLGALFHEPTVLADVTPDMRVFQEETFGPIITISRVETVDEAIQLANDSNYGLSSSVWSKNRQRAVEAGLKIDTGDVNINCALLNFGNASAEFGGQKDSGVGRRNGKQGLLKYTSTQSVFVDNFPQMPDSPTIYTKRVVFLLNAVRRLKRYFPFIGN